MRNKTSQNGQDIITRIFSYRKASRIDCFPVDSRYCGKDSTSEGVFPQNLMMSQGDDCNNIADRQNATNFLETPRDDICRSSSFTYKSAEVSEISDYRKSFPLQKGRQCSSSDAASLLAKPDHLNSMLKGQTMVPSLDAASQTSQKKGLMNSIVRQLSFRSSKSTRTKQRSSELDELNGQPGVVAYASLIRLFECPGCLTLMNPPFYQCRKGHIVCEKCKISLKYICPTCRQRITEETNVMMEKVCHLVSFPCRFNKFGCTEYYAPNDKQDHESFCQYRPVHCQFSAQGCQKVLTLRDMKSHIDECDFKEFASE